MPCLTEQSVSYGSGSFSGQEWLDTVTLSSSLVISKQSIGVARSAQGFDGVDGILGIGPDGLTRGTVSGGSVVPTVTSNLVSQGEISAKSVGIAFAPGGASGSLSFGGPDTSKYTGSLQYTSITTTSPASGYVGVTASFTYGSSSSKTILRSTAGIIDTGTSLVLLATDAFDAYKSATGAVLDSQTGLLRLTQAQYANLQNFVVHVGSASYTLIPNAQRVPASLNGDIGGDANSVYLIFGDFGEPSGEGLDFILGMFFLYVHLQA
jgi:saccharopepsin